MKNFLFNYKMMIFFIKNYHFVLNFSFYQIFTLSSGFT